VDLGKILPVQKIKICTEHSNIYLRQLLDFKVCLAMRLSGTIMYLFNKRFSMEPWLARKGRVKVEGVEPGKEGKN
jgi:hypothetical protein